MLISYFHYLFKSKHKSKYKQIANKNGSSAYHVFLIAHGKETSNAKDEDILQDLIDSKIIYKRKI